MKTRAYLGLAAALAFLPTAVSATTPTPVRGGVRPVPVAAKAPEHAVFGTIASLKGTRFVLRTRIGRALPVDASAAIASGRFSAPLFVGKVVVVTGALDAAGTLHAVTVTRFTRLDERTPRDR
jgi:hypothetical protein